ncbi:MAG: MATE family efflux transporter [bacterium]
MFSRVFASPPKPGGMREVTNIAFPLVMSTASMTVMHFIDRMFLSWLGAEYIAAAMPAGIVSFTVTCFFLGVAGFANTFVAQYHGAGEPDNCTRSTWQGIYLSIIASAIIPLFWFAGPWLFSLAHHTERVYELEVVYFRILIWAGGPSVAANAVSSFFSGRGKTGVVMKVSILANCVNAVLDYGLIFGAFGLPRMGIAGAGIATVIASVVSVFLYLYLFLCRGIHTEYRTRTLWHFRPSLFRRLLSYGTPAGVSFFLDVAAFSTFVLLVGRIGPIELAASNIVFSINTLAFLPMIGVNQAVSILVGQYIGRKDVKTAEKSTYSSLYLVMVYMGIMSVLYVLFPERFLDLFASEETSAADWQQILDYGRIMLVMVAAYGLFDAGNLVFSGALRGAGDTRFVMWMAVVMAWVLFVPPVYILIVWLGRGVLAAWAWVTLYVCLLAVVFYVRFRAGRWQHIKIRE